MAGCICKDRADTPLVFVPHLGVHLRVNSQAGRYMYVSMCLLALKNAFVKISRVKKQSLRNYIKQLTN